MAEDGTPGSFRNFKRISMKIIKFEITINTLGSFRNSVKTERLIARLQVKNSEKHSKMTRNWPLRFSIGIFDDESMVK